MSTCHRRKAGRKRCRVGTMSLATSCDITQHHAIGGGSGSGAGGVRCHSTKGVAEESRGGGSGSRRRAGVGSGRGSPYRKGFLEMYYKLTNMQHIDSVPLFVHQCVKPEAGVKPM